MTFRTVQKIKGKHYLYESEGVWDPEKKQCRQKRTYIGPCDENGILLPEKQRNILVESRTFGQYHLLFELAKQSGISHALSDAFGIDDGMRILALAILRISCPKTLRNIGHQLDETFVRELLDTDDPFTSQYLSSFLSRTGKKEDFVAKYTKALMNDDETVILDLTSFCSSSKLYDMLEYGDDYRRTKLPQVSFGLVHSMTRNMPIWYRLFPGSIADKATLKGMLVAISELGSGACHAVMDRGFYSPDNLMFMLENDIGFTIPMPFNLKTAKTLVSESNRPLDDPTCAHVVKDSVVRIWETRCEAVGGRNVRTIVYLDENRRTEQQNTLFSRVEDFERRMSGTDWHPNIMKEAAKNRNDRGLLKMVSLSKGPDGTVAVERKRNAMSFELNKCGKIIILTTSDDDALDVLVRYRLRNEAEKLFETLKDELDGGVNYLSSHDSVSGMIFAEFVSVSLRYVLAERLRGAELPGKVWIPDVLGLMNKLKITYMNGKWRLNEVSKKQREMYSALGVPIPEPGDYLNRKPLS